MLVVRSLRHVGRKHRCTVLFQHEVITTNRPGMPKQACYAPLYLPRRIRLFLELPSKHRN